MYITMYNKKNHSRYALCKQNKLIPYIAYYIIKINKKNKKTVV